VGVRLAVAAAALAVAGTPVQYLEGRQLAGGGFAEQGGSPSPQLTAWAVLGLRAAHARPGAAALGYLVAHEDELSKATDVELVAMAESVLGREPDGLLAPLRRSRRRIRASSPP